MMKKTYVHEFVWVNAGEWRKSSSYEAAIDAATLAAHRADVTGQVHEVHIVRQHCGEGHIDICDHLQVTLVFGEYGEYR